MKLLLDVGNTAITYGMAKNARISSFGTCHYNDIPKLSNKCLESGKYKQISVVISSVVPKITKLILIKFNQNTTFRPLLAGKNLPVPIKSRYQKGKLGIDRQINIFGALQYYKAPLLILDFGTAITADYVSRAGVFEGGLILPGPGTAWKALLSRGAMLPKNLSFPDRSQGLASRNTKSSLISGILEGYGAMTDGLVQRFKRKYGSNLKVLATGGYAPLIYKNSDSIDILDPQLSVKSLLTLSQQA